MYDSKEKFSTATIALHWVVALTIFAQWPLGLYMATKRTYRLWPVHQSIGYLLFIVILIRVMWRFKNGWPTPVSVYSPAEWALAKTVHWTLIIALLIMPLSGIVSTYAGGYDITILGWQIIPDVPNHLVLPDGAIHKLKVIPRNEALHDFLQKVHIVFAWILAGAFLLHVAGALKHHFVDGDGTLRRMLGARVK